MNEDYEFDDPPTERLAVIDHWMEQGFPPDVPADLIALYEESGADPIAACREAMGDLSPVMDPGWDLRTRQIAREVAGFEADEAAFHARVLRITDVILRHITPERLAEIRQSWQDERDGRSQS